MAVNGNVLYANYLGYIFALNLETGKLIWRSASFHNLEIPASQGQARMLDTKRFAILASKTHVWTLSRDLKDPNQFASFVLTCRRADGGDVAWQSTNLPDYAQVDLVSTPILAGETLYVVGKTPMNQQQGQPHQYVLAIRASDGKLLWKVEVGTFRQMQQQFFFYGMTDDSPQPKLFKHAGSIYVDTHVGVLARLDAESGELDWGYGYQTAPVEGSRFFFFGMMQPERVVRQQRALEGRRGPDLERGKVGADPRPGFGPDENVVGSADRRVGAPARRRRPDCFPRRTRDQRTRSPDPQALVGHAPAGREHGGKGSRAAGRHLAAHASGHL